MGCVCICFLLLYFLFSSFFNRAISPLATSLGIVSKPLAITAAARPPSLPLGALDWLSPVPLTARRGVRTHRIPDMSMLVLGTDTRPLLMASAFLLMFPETGDPVPCSFAHLLGHVAGQRAQTSWHTYKRQGSLPPSSWFQFLLRASHRAVGAREPIPPRAGPAALSQHCGF